MRRRSPMVPVPGDAVGDERKARRPYGGSKAHLPLLPGRQQDPRPGPGGERHAPGRARRTRRNENLPKLVPRGQPHSRRRWCWAPSPRPAWRWGTRPLTPGGTPQTAAGPGQGHVGRGRRRDKTRPRPAVRDGPDALHRADDAKAIAERAKARRAGVQTPGELEAPRRLTTSLTSPPSSATAASCRRLMSCSASWSATGRSTSAGSLPTSRGHSPRQEPSRARPTPTTAKPGSPAWSLWTSHQPSDAARTPPSSTESEGELGSQRDRRENSLRASLARLPSPDLRKYPW